MTLIWKKDGWRAFVFRPDDESIDNLEENLDKLVPSHEKAGGFLERKPKLVDELETLLVDIGYMLYVGGRRGEYHPMKFRNELEENN